MVKTNYNFKGIRKWQIDADITQAVIAADVGCSESLVSMVFRGKRRNQKIIDAFVRRGCPREFFGPDINDKELR